MPDPLTFGPRGPRSPKFSGVFVPTVVPLRDDGSVNEPELRRLVDFLIDRGAAGLYPNGSTGEFLRFTDAERLHIASVTLDQAAGRVPVMVGLAEANVAVTRELAARYADMGAAAAAVVSPFYYRLSEEAVYEWFAAIAGESPLDLMLYNIPIFASPITVETVRRLAADCPRVVGIKDSSGDVANMTGMAAAVTEARPDFCLMTGWDTTLVSMLLSGADGGTNASANVVPEVMAAIYGAAAAGDVSRAWELQRKLTPLFNAMLGPDFPIGFREATALRGLDVGPSRLPQSAAQRAAAKELVPKLQAAIDAMGDVLRP